MLRCELYTRHEATKAPNFITFFSGTPGLTHEHTVSDRPSFKLKALVFSVARELL